MNRLTKSLVAVGLIAGMVMPLAAMAMVNVENAFPNGEANVTVPTGSLISLDVFVKNTGIDEIESLFVRYPMGGGQAAVGWSFDVPDKAQPSPVNGWFFHLNNVPVPVSPGTYGMEVCSHAIVGDGADNTATTPADDCTPFSAQVTVTAVTPSVPAPTYSPAPSATPTPVATSTPTPTPAPIGGGSGNDSCANLTHYLSYGMMHNDEVAVAQAVLIDNGYDSYITYGATGNFLVQTRAAVKAFQRDHGISQTGSIGPRTRAALNDLPCQG